jgi:ribosomal protein S7
MSMKKLSSDEVAATLSQVGPTLRALSEENVALKEKVAHFERRERVEKIASAMERKGLDPDTTYDQKVDTLMGQDNLDVVEQAIEMSAPQIKLAAVSDHAGNPSDAKSAFEVGILED